MKKEKERFNFLKLKYLIKDRYGSQQAFAEKMNMSEDLLSMKLNNRIRIKYEEILKMIELLDIQNEDVKSVFFTKEC